MQFSDDAGCTEVIISRISGRIRKKKTTTITTPIWFLIYLAKLMIIMIIYLFPSKLIQNRRYNILTVAFRRSLIECDFCTFLDVLILPAVCLSKCLHTFFQSIKCVGNTTKIRIIAKQTALRKRGYFETITKIYDANTKTFWTIWQRKRKTDRVIFKTYVECQANYTSKLNGSS